MTDPNPPCWLVATLIHSHLVRSFNRYLLSTYKASALVTGAGDTAGNRTDKHACQGHSSGQGRREARWITVPAHGDAPWSAKTSVNGLMDWDMGGQSRHTWKHGLKKTVTSRKEGCEAAKLGLCPFLAPGLRQSQEKSRNSSEPTQSLLVSGQKSSKSAECHWVYT